jgi:hypothetical protein
MAELEFAPLVLAAISRRRSVRAFLNRPVASGLVEEILATAARAPSGNNSQPWRVHVPNGPAKTRLAVENCLGCQSCLPSAPHARIHRIPCATAPRNMHMLIFCATVDVSGDPAEQTA